MDKTKLDQWIEKEPELIEEGGSYFYNGFPVTVDLINDDDSCIINYESGRHETVDISDLEYTDYEGE